MASFLEALAALGVDPASITPASRSARAADYRPVQRPAAPQVGAAGLRAPAAPVGASQGRFANAVDLVPGPAGVQEEDDGGGVGGLFKTVGGKALQALAAPGNYLRSGIQEATDFLAFDTPLGDLLAFGDDNWKEKYRNEDGSLPSASWDQFVSQGREGYSTRDLMDANSPGTQGKGGLYSALGFAGDVVLDPLTFLTAGTGTAAGVTASGAARQAVADGGGRVLAKQLADDAIKAGLRNDPAVQQLVANAAMRGRGAITPRGLAAAGIDDVTREALGIPQLARTIGRDGIRIPGSTAVANVVEDTKGVAKNFLKTRPATQAFRNLTPNTLGRRNLMTVLASRAHTVGEKFDAIVAESTINRAGTIAKDWASTTDQRIVRSSDLGKALKKLDDTGGRALTDSIESGVSDPMADALRGEFRTMLDDARRFGVDVGNFGPDYVPHMITHDLRALARKNPEAAKIVVGLETEVGSQKFRQFGIHEGQTPVFLGETLQTGTISELNGISMKKLGVEAFEADVRNTLPKYIDQMSRAIARAQQIDMLVQKGVVRPKAIRMVRKEMPDTPERVAARDAAGRVLKQARENEVVSLRDGSTYRRKQLAAARDAVFARRRQINAEVAAIERKIKDASRGLGGAQAKLARAQKELATAKDALANWKTAARTQRGAARREAQAQIKKLEARVAEINKMIDINQTAVKRIMGNTEISLPERALMTQTPAAGVKAWQAQRNALLEESAELAARADELHKLKIGDGPMPAEQRIAAATERFQTAQLATKGVSKEVDLAARSLDGAIADRQVIMDEMVEVKRVLDDIMDKATGAPRADKAVTLAVADELRDRVAIISQIAARENMDDLSKIMAQHEAVALAADAAALKARGEIATMEQMLDAMSQKRFANEAVSYVENGMKEIGDDLQIPEWLDNALQVEAIKMNWAEANKYIRKFYNLWKGYAILRPGFHVRNAYSAMFNMYLEAGAGSFANVRRASMFDDLAMRHPTDYLARATQRWGSDEASMLNEAYMAMRGTGAGQAAGEFTASALHKGKFNPLSDEFRLLKRNRQAGEWVERKIRTAHAYDVLKRGGNIDQAVDVVRKWHFDYTDVGSFDRAMKQVMPFWTFFSRNLALQGQTWVRSSAKLARVYGAAERNLAYGQPEDTYVPDWYGDAGALRLPGVGADGSVKYLFPDLPQAQFLGQMDKFTTPWTGQFLGEVGPVKTPFEIMAGKQFFSGVPLEAEPVEAGSAGMLLDKLGISGALGLGGTGVDGTSMLDERAQYAINSLIPGAGQLDRYLGLGGDANAERQPYSLAGALTGISVRENNDRTRRGEQYRRMLEAQAAAEWQAKMGG